MAKKIELTTTNIVDVIQDGVVVYFIEKGLYLRGIIIGASALVETCNHTTLEYTVKVVIDGKISYHKMNALKMHQTANKMFAEDIEWEGELRYAITRPALYDAETILTSNGQVVRGRIVKMYNSNIIQQCEFSDWTVTVRDENGNTHVGKFANMLKINRTNSSLIKGDI